MMFMLKESCELDNLQSPMWAAVLAAMSVYDEHDTELVITSGSNGKHRRHSEHKQGCALDIRTWNLELTDETKHLVARDIQARLTPQYQVAYEPDRYEQGLLVRKEHIHMQWSPP